MLMDLNKEILNELGITIVGDIIAVLKHAKVVYRQVSPGTRDSRGREGRILFGHRLLVPSAFGEWVDPERWLGRQ